MKKILISFNDDTINFKYKIDKTKQERDLSKTLLNTNVISNDELLFSDNYLKNNNLSVLPKSVIESYLKSERTNKNDGIYLYDEKDLNRSMNAIIKKKDNPNFPDISLSNSIHFEKTAFKSFKKIPKLKGILRNKKKNMFKHNSDMSSGIRRVSFGWREESF